MLKISNSVFSIFRASDIARAALQEGILDISAFAEHILPEVEKRTHKKVKKNSISMALYRISKEKEFWPLKPKISLEQVNIKSPLVVVTFEKTKATLNAAAEVSRYSHSITQGIHEITLLCDEEKYQKIVEVFEVKPKVLLRDCLGVSLAFSEAYLKQPNIIYTILSALAIDRINLLEVVSTSTELTLVIHEDQLSLTLQVLKNFLRKRNTT